MPRLRNRIVKAEFWTDPELLRWPLSKRHFYQGLWAAAEDSACLEDDAFGWKLTLFPSPIDGEVTVEVLEGWRDELVEADKLIPYMAQGKPYLYLATFHDTEKPRNPQSPTLPLPAWVTHGKTPVGRGSGEGSRNTYHVHPELLPEDYRVRTNELPTPLSSPVLSSPKTLTAGFTYSEGYLEDKLGRPLKKDERESMARLVGKVGDDKAAAALGEAIQRGNARDLFGLAHTIAKDWEQGAT